MATAEEGRETDSGIEIKPVYTEDDVEGLELELPGEYPFTPRPYTDMYRGCPWTIRQYAGFVSRGDEPALPVPARARPDWSSVAFDPDAARVRPDDARAEGEVGRTGVAIDSIADMELLFDGISLNEVSTSMTINAPALLLLLYEPVAEEQGVSEEICAAPSRTTSSRSTARGNYIYPPRPTMRITTDLFAYCHERLPRFNTISISGYHIARPA